MSKTKGEKSAVRENTIDEKRAMRRRRNKRKKKEERRNSAATKKNEIAALKRSAEVAKSKAQNYRLIAQKYQKLLAKAEKVSAVTYSYSIQHETFFRMILYDCCTDIKHLISSTLTLLDSVRCVEGFSPIHR